MNDATTARIYWDSQALGNVGWAWAIRVNGEHDDSGPLGPGYQHHDTKNLELLRSATVAELQSQFADEVTESITDIVVVRFGYSDARGCAAKGRYNGYGREQIDDDGGPTAEDMGR